MKLAKLQSEAMNLAQAYFGSHILFALNELGVFDLLAEAPSSVADLAAAAGADPDALGRLLDGAVAVGLLSKVGGGYANADLAAVLVRGSPGYLGNWVRLMARYSEAWMGLAETVRTGRPSMDASRQLGGDPAFTRDFAEAMADYARVRGGGVVEHLDLQGIHRMLDLGGGPGTYSLGFARRWPGLRVTLFDLPEVADIALANSRAEGLEDRVAIRAGDYLVDDLGGGYDMAFVSDVLHQERPQEAERLLRRVFEALRPGGRVVVQSMFLDEDRAGPRWAVMLSLLMLLVYGGGRNYTVSEVREMLEAVGFVRPQHLRLTLASVNSLLLARRPGQNRS